MAGSVWYLVKAHAHPARTMAALASIPEQATRATVRPYRSLPVGRTSARWR